MDYSDEVVHSCVSGLVDIQNPFLSSHRLLSVLVCLLGCVGNAMAVIVLTNKLAMVSSTNLLLTGRAIADMFSNILYLVDMSCTTSAVKAVPVLDMIAGWLTVAAAGYWGMRRALALTICAYVLAPLLSTPLFLTYCVKLLPTTDGDFQTGSEELLHIPAVPPPPDLGDRDDQTLVDFIHWVYGVLFKVIPCVLLATLWRKRQHRILYSSSDEGPHKTPPARLLNLMFVIFTAFQVTGAILNAVNLTYNDHTMHKSYRQFFDVLDLLNLLNRGLIFIIFLAMSGQFRQMLMSFLRTNIFSCFFKYSENSSMEISFKRC